MSKLAPLDEADDGFARIGILDGNRTVVTRAARIACAAAGLRRVAADADPSVLRAQLSPETQLLLCNSNDLELALEWSTARFLRASIVTWSHGPMAPLLELASTRPRMRSLLGWPSFLSMPRPWEIALAVRRVLIPAEPTLHLGDLFATVPVVRKFKPASSEERDHVAAQIGAFAERAGAHARLVSKVTDVSHELLMNAMYDAPVNHYGEPRYAHDRRAHITLDEHEIPTVRVATDGILVALQVTDPFGRLTRAHVLNSIGRGQIAATTMDSDRIIDASHGGAGLGFWRIYAASASTIVDVIPGHTTSVTAIFDLDVGPREARTMPPSLHLFGRDDA